MSLVRSVFTIGGYTFLSRILGFVRDIFIAAILGAGMQADAFFVAFKLPNFMRRIFAEGAFSAAFVPQFSRILTAEGQQAAREFAEDALAVLFFALLFMTAIFEIGMPIFMYVLAPGFSANPEKFELSIVLSRITFPYLLMISLVALFGGVLNSLERYTAFASAPVLMNLALIAGLLVFGPHSKTYAHGLAWGVLLAGLVQMVWLMGAMWKAGIWLRLKRPRLTPPVKKLLKLMIPVTLGASVAQINLLVDVMLASLIPEAVSYLYYADRLNELPLGVIGIAIGTALLPMLSKQARLGNEDEARKTLNRALEITLFLCLPAAFALMVLAEPLMKVLFERGAFTPEAAHKSAQALVAYAIGLPSFVMTKVFAPGFFAREDTKTPVKIALVSMAVNLVLNLALMFPLKHVGLALATSLAGWLNAWMLGRALYTRGHFAPDTRLKKRLISIFIASTVMAIGLYGLTKILAPWLLGSIFVKASGLGLIILGGMAIFSVGAMVSGAAKPHELKRYLLPRRFH